MIALLPVLCLAFAPLQNLGPSTGSPTTQQKPAAAAPPPAPASAPASVPANPAQNPSTTPTPPPGGRESSQGSGQGGQLPQIVDAGDTWLVNFDETEGCDLESLTKVCQQATGINFTYDEATATKLRTVKVKIFGQKRIPKGDFYAFYQIVMFINQFVCTKVGADPLSLVVLQDLPTQQGGRSNLRSEAIYVLPEELDKYASQVATQIITVLHLPHTDVRSIGNSLRPLIGTDPSSGGVVPVGNTNSVILQGFASSVASLARILMLVDRESANDTAVAPVFEVIPLEFASAQDIADVLEQLLEAKQRQTERNRTQAGAQGATGAIQNAGGETKILVDARTNSLLVMALPDDLQNIKELVARLDVDVVEPERTYHVYALENVKAEDLAKVLEDFIQDASRVTPGGKSGRATPGAPTAPGTGGAGGSSASDSETVVVPDPATNSLLIAASKTRYQELLDLITKLDRRKDQVLIETALIELSGTDFRDLGVELGFADIPGAGSLGGFGVTSFGLSELKDTDNDGVPDIRVPSLSSGVTAGILDGDNFGLPVLLKALKGKTDTNVLSVPSVLVNNNGSATIMSIDEQPTTTVTLGGVGGQTQENFSGYQKAGITMQISPSISASGYLRLDVFLEISTFGQKTSQASSIPPPRLTRTIQSSVNVPNGDTMVVGGIITDNKSSSRNQTPWLGDLPVIGALFRSDSNTSNRITLYFFVTPHILRDKDFADLAELSYQKKLEAADKIGIGRIRLVDPTFGEETNKVNLGTFDVPLYRSQPTGEVDPHAVGLDPVKRASMLKSKSGETPAPAEAGSSAQPLPVPEPAPEPATPENKPPVPPASQSGGKGL
jgi:general secretion pathway protein D